MVHENAPFVRYRNLLGRLVNQIWRLYTNAETKEEESFLGQLYSQLNALAIDIDLRFYNRPKIPEIDEFLQTKEREIYALLFSLDQDLEILASKKEMPTVVLRGYEIALERALSGYDRIIEAEIRFGKVKADMHAEAGLGPQARYWQTNGQTDQAHSESATADQPKKEKPGMHQSRRFREAEQTHPSDQRIAEIADSINDQWDRYFGSTLISYLRIADGIGMARAKNILFSSFQFTASGYLLADKRLPLAARDLFLEQEFAPIDVIQANQDIVDERFWFLVEPLLRMSLTTDYREFKEATQVGSNNCWRSFAFVVRSKSGLRELFKDILKHYRRTRDRQGRQ